MGAEMELADLLGKPSRALLAQLETRVRERERDTQTAVLALRQAEMAKAESGAYSEYIRVRKEDPERVLAGPEVQCCFHLPARAVGGAVAMMRTPRENVVRQIRPRKRLPCPMPPLAVRGDRRRRRTWGEQKPRPRLLVDSSGAFRRSWAAACPVARRC